MLLVQLCLAFLLGMLGPLAGAAAVRRGDGGWYAWSGVLLAAWVAGVSSILVLRFPDWAVLYLYEAMGRSLLFLVLLGALFSSLAARVGMWLVVPLLLVGRLRPALLRMVVAAAASAAVIVLVHDRLVVVATTLEFRHGLGRPSSRVSGFQGLFDLVLIGIAVPCLGALILLLVESLRLRRAAAGPN